MKENDVFELKPINSRFKRLINDFGNQWVVVGCEISMSCFGGEKGVTARPINNLIKWSNFKVSEIN